MARGIDPVVRERIGQNIREARQRAGLSQVELAKVLGRTQDAVSKWELGVNEHGLEDAHAIAAACGVTLDWLISQGEMDPVAIAHEVLSDRTHSTAELIEQIKNLPPEVKREIGRFLVRELL